MDVSRPEGASQLGAGSGGSCGAEQGGVPEPWAEEPRPLDSAPLWVRFCCSQKTQAGGPALEKRDPA